MGERKEYPTDSDSSLPPADTAIHVAKKILEAIETEKPEIYTHKWMKAV